MIKHNNIPHKNKLLLLSVAISSLVTVSCTDSVSDFFDNLEKNAANIHVVNANNPQPLPVAANSYELPRVFTSKGKLVNTQKFIDDSGTLGLVITKDGNIVYESYLKGKTKDDTFASWSMAKSITSALVGIAVEEGKLSVDDTVASHLPEFSNSIYADVTVEDLLTMSSAVKFDETYSNLFSDVHKLFGSTKNNMAAEILKLKKRTQDATTKQDHQPGEYNDYKSADTQVLGMVLKAAIGEDISTYLQNKIWQPAGMRQNATWMADKTQTEATFCCLKTTTRDMAKFGNIYLNQGSYNGQQIVPASWVSQSLDTSAPRLQAGKNNLSANIWSYGYQWWIPPAQDNTNADRNNDFVAVGVFNQYTYISPRNGSVIAKHSAPPNYFINDLGTEHTDFLRLVSLQQGATYQQIHHPSSGSCLAVSTVGNQTKLVNDTCSQHLDQQWYLETSTQLLRNRMGGCLTYADNLTDFSGLSLAACDANNAQQKTTSQAGAIQQLQPLGVFEW